MKVFFDDISAYIGTPTSLHWAFSKLEVSKRLHYNTNPFPIPPIQSGLYCVRPILNLSGMGRGASITWLSSVNVVENPGYFWTEVFHGNHYSVDYYMGKPMSMYKGIRKKSNPLWRWDCWVRDDISKAPPIPSIFDDIITYVSWINVEWIGDKVVEIHLRPTAELEKSWFEYHPVWSEPTHTDIYEWTSKGFKFLELQDDKRIGFWVK